MNLYKLKNYVGGVLYKEATQARSHYKRLIRFFQDWDECQESQYDQTAYPLQLEAFRGYRKARNEESQAFKDLFKNPVNTGVRNLPVDLSGIEADESKKARNEDWLGSISKDAYLRETLSIMHDLINQKGLTKK